MGRMVTDGLSIDVEAPAGEVIEKGELYRIDEWTGFSFDEIDAAEVDRGMALDVSHALYRVKVPAGTCGTKGLYVQWSAGAGFKDGAVDLVDGTVVRALASVAKVEGVRNSRGYATLKLVTY